MDSLVDIRTLLLVITVVLAFRAAVMGYVWVIARQYEPVRYWALGSALVAAGTLLVGLRGLVPAPLSIVVAQSLLLGGWLAIDGGVAIAAGRKPPWGAGIALGVAGVAGAAWFLFADPDLAARTVATSLPVIVFDAWAAVACFRANAGPRRTTLRLLGLVTGMLSASNLLKTVHIFRHDLQSMFPSDWPVAQFYLVATAATVAGTVLFVLLAVQRLQEHLDRELAERRRDAGQLRASLEEAHRFRMALDNVPALVYLKDAQGRYQYANRPTTELFGCTLEDLVGRDDSGFLPPPIAARLREIDLAVLGGRDSTEEIELPDGKGGHRVFLDFKTPIRGDAARGAVTGVCGIATDVTAIRESETRYRTVADFTYDWEYWRLPDGSLRYVSPACERMTGYRAEEFLRDPGLVESVVHPADRAQVALHLARVETAREGGADPCELDFRIVSRAGEERWIRHVCRQVTDEAGRFLGRRASNRDMTAARRLEERQRALEARLRESQKLEAVGLLAGGIAHDFNNVLGVILGNCQLARQDLREHPEEAELSLAEIERGGVRARNLVRQILAFSRQETMAMTVMSLRPVVAEVAKLVRAILPAGMELSLNLSEEPLCVACDPTQIERVVVNLCTNAWRACDDGRGTVGIVLRRATPEDLGAAAIAGSPAGHALLAVSDDGRGMDAQTVGRIFEPFFTTRKPGEGTGLGLSVVHGIVSAHQGVVRVESEPGVGSRFHILLPLAAAPAGG